MTHRIFCVRTTGVPPQILKAIVCPHSVIVARLHSFGTWAYECFKDEAVDTSIILFAVFA